MGAIHQALLMMRKATAGGPGGLSDFQLWYDAAQETGFSNGDEMSTVQDWSGNNRDGTGVVDNVLKPTYRSSDGPNSNPCFRLMSNTTSQGGHFTVPDFLTGFTAGHYFAVVKLDIDPAIISKCAPPLGDWGSNTTGDLYPFPTDNKIYDAWGSNARKTTVDPSQDLKVWHVYEVRSASGAWSNYIDGSQLFTTGTNTVGWSTVPKVGGTQTNSNRLFGMIKEILFYSSVKSGADLTTIYDYLETENGITLP